MFSQLRCNGAMKQVYAALKQVGLVWKIVGPFRLVCKWADQGDRRPISMGVQIYRMADNPKKGYLVDFSVAGPETVPTINVINHVHTILGDMQ